MYDRVGKNLPGPDLPEIPLHQLLCEPGGGVPVVLYTGPAWGGPGGAELPPSLSTPCTRPGITGYLSCANHATLLDWWGDA